MSNKEQSLINIQAQIKSLLGVDVDLKFEDEEIDYTFGTAIRFDCDSYSPEVARYYGREIKLDEQKLLEAYAITYGRVPANANKVSFSEEETNYTFLPEVEGIIELTPDFWYRQESQRKGVRVDNIPGQFAWISVNSASAYLFKPNSNVKIKITKELVWGCQHEDDWEFYSSWTEDRSIDPNYYEKVGDTGEYYAKQQEVWKAEIM